MSATIRRLTNNATRTGGTGTGDWRFDFPEQVKGDLGVDYVVFNFSDNPANFVDVTIEFLFQDPANTFIADDGKILFCGSYLFDGWIQRDGANGVGTAAGESFFFSTDEAYNNFVAEFLADERMTFITTY